MEEIGNIDWLIGINYTNGVEGGIEDMPIYQLTEVQEITLKESKCSFIQKHIFV